METIIVLAGWSSICIIWFGLILSQRRVRREGLFIEGTTERPRDDMDFDDAASVCVVVPARNESRCLAVCLRSILRQDYPKLSVRVIDDRSRDGTYAIAEEFARCDARVTLHRIENFPPMWMGKSHALWKGTRGLRENWLLFIDVDCTLERGAVARAIQAARERDVKFLSLWPQQAPGGFWEHATIPLCAGIIALWFGSGRVNDASGKGAFANGQFLLFDRVAYERIGGHRAVRSAVIEDIALAEHAKASGLACWVGSGRALVSVRMYENYVQIVNGWARIYVGALRSGSKIALSIIWLLVGSLLPYVAAVGLAVSMYALWKAGETISADLIALAAMCATHLILLMIASFRFWGMGGCRRVDLIWYPLSVCIVVRIMARSWWWLTIRRCVPWRDRCYRIDHRGRIVG